MRKILLYSLLLFLSRTSVLWALPFENLDFESATVSNLPPDTEESVSVTAALPGWTAYFGTNQITEVGHNIITLGSVNVGVWGPNYGFAIPPLQGDYSAILQPGSFGNLQGLSASIAQTGLVPSSAKSMQFLAALAFTNDLVVTLGGQTLAVVSLGSNLYGCDVSAFTGSVENLEFTIAYNNDHGNDLNFLDDITFSTQAVPEPSPMSLLLAGVTVLGIRRFTSRKTE